MQKDQDEITNMMIQPAGEARPHARRILKNDDQTEVQPQSQSLEKLKLLNKAQHAFITQKTPPQFIKKRPGPGGKWIDYVEVGYIINILNQAFGWDWDFRVTDQQIGKAQVWVKGELTIRVKDRAITKAQYGGSDIKMNRNGEPISVADDLKAASSDALKKCASMIGIAGDIYWRDLDNWNQFESTVEE